jgi:hypothetical protein
VHYTPSIYSLFHITFFVRDLFWNVKNASKLLVSM